MSVRPPFNLSTSESTNIQESWYERYATRGHPHIALLRNFLQSEITTWLEREFVGWKWQYHPLILGIQIMCGNLKICNVSYGNSVGIVLIGFPFCDDENLVWRQTINIYGPHVSFK